MSVSAIIALLKAHNVFARVEGDSLKLVGNTAQLPADIVATVRAAKSDLLAYLKNAARQTEGSAIQPIAQQLHYPVSHAQKRIWVLSQLDGGNTAYNITTHFFLKGALDTVVLQQALDALVQRHESLRTVFKELDGLPVQVVHERMEISMGYGEAEANGDIPSFIRHSIEAAGSHVFDLAVGPLVKINLLRLDQDSHLLVLVAHHIISDGWSIAVMLKEWLQYYAAFVKGQPETPTPLPIQYKDYCHWQTQQLQGPQAQAAAAFWKAEFDKPIEPLNLHTYAPRPAIQNFEGAVARFYLDTALYTGITAFCKEHGVTLFHFLRSTVGILLSKWSGQQTVVLGSPVAGRHHSLLQQQLGLYVNTLPLKTAVDPTMAFLPWLQSIAVHTNQAFEHQAYPFDRILDDLAVKRQAGSNPLFDIMLVLQDVAAQNIATHPDSGLVIGTGNQLMDGEPLQLASKFDITFNFSTDTDNRFYAELEYATALFAHQRMAQMFNALIFIMQQVLQQPQMPIAQIQLADAQARQKILQVFNRPIGHVDTHSIAALLKNAFANNRDAIALKDAQTELSFAQTEQHAAQIAAQLKPLIAANKNLFVGLLVERSVWMIAGIVGILQAGGAYVPIDITYPPSRVDYIVNDAQLELIVVDDAGMALVPPTFNGLVLHVNTLLQGQETSEVDTITDRRNQTAYLIYTSGSTGKPKGVEISHQNAIAFLQWSMAEFAATDYDVLYATTSYCFDLSVFEFFVPLLQGKTIRVLQSALEIQQYISGDKKVMLNTVPSVVRHLLDTGMHWQHLAALNMAGEPIPKKIKAEIDYTAIEVRNLYGPSEDTTYSTIYRFANDVYPFIPIGTPVGYTQVYIMDAWGQLQPEGVEGEIYLSGLSVAKGYYNKPELTAERFLPNPFLPGMRMYKTGDLGKWLPDGQIAFSGRADDQVKVRGYRIELGEIAFLLEQHQGVEEAVVVIQHINGANEMVAYCVCAPEFEMDLLKPWLATQLPAWMVPAYWVKMDRIPLNSNGKTDKAQLPMPTAMAGDATTLHTAPENELESTLLHLWQQVLPQAEQLGTTHHFFNIGGHSLHAIKLRSLIAKATGKEPSLSELFENPTVRQQAALLGKKPRSIYQAIQPQPDQPWYPISQAQERLWVMNNFAAASKAYHMQAAFAITGALDIDKLEQAFKLVIDRHSILRTVFAEHDGQPQQHILSIDDSRFGIERFETGTNNDQALQHWIIQHDTAPFDLQKGPLLRCWLLQTLTGQVLYINMHHIISDGWSVILLNKEVLANYRLLLDGADAALPPLDIQYQDFAVWQRAQSAGEQMWPHQQFWKAQFADGVPVLELPTDYNRPDTKTYNGAQYRFQFGKTASQQINRLAKESGISLYTVLMASVHVLLKKYANQTDIVTGTTLAGRTMPQLEDAMGFFVNALPVRSLVRGEMAFDQLLAQEHDTLIKVYEHQSFPFEALIAALELKRNLSRSPLFDVMVVLQNLDGQQQLHQQAVTSALQLEQLGLHFGTAKYDLTFLFEETADGLQLLFEYNTDLYDSTTAQQMSKHLARLLEQVTAAPHIKVKDILLPDSKELGALLAKADRTHIAYDTTATIVGLFNKAAAEYADEIALVVGTRQMTYRELDTKSGQLAAMLMQQYQVQSEDLVALHVERSEWMLIAILGVLKAGAAYVPIDPAYPVERMEYIIGDTQTNWVLYDVAPAAVLHQANDNIQCIDLTQLDYVGDTAQADVQPHQLAYVIYTSGTTGQPKGVLIEHRNLTRLLFTDDSLFDFDANDRWSLFHSYCFDFSVWEMYGALLNGGTLVMVPKAVAQDSIAFYDFLAVEKITVLNQTPTAFRSLVQQNQERFSQMPLTVRYLIFGGEALLPEVLKQWHEALPGCQNINMYGITETTVHVTFKAITDAEIRENKSNIGLPIPTLSCYVLDDDMQQVPLGVIGELCVGGAGVARGYLNQPALTAAKFVDNPYRPGEKMYRSGDFARILHNGDLVYIGRKDDQVKIRGHRIETAEVETALMQQPGVKDALVLAIKNALGEHELAAYYIDPTESTSPAKLRTGLLNQLPAYMVPTYLMALPAFPINSNGKLDKQALPKPQEMEHQSGCVPPRHETDKQLIAIWEEVLERKGIGITDNFFELGGHSLKATRVIGRIHERYHIKIDLKEIFTEPTIEHLSNYIEMAQWSATVETAAVGDEDKMIF